jgi:hypothetical protein
MCPRGAKCEKVNGSRLVTMSPCELDISSAYNIVFCVHVPVWQVPVCMCPRGVTGPENMLIRCCS